MFACFQMYVKSTFFLFCFVFNFHMIFFSPQTCVDSVDATIFMKKARVSGSKRRVQ